MYIVIDINSSRADCMADKNRTKLTAASFHMPMVVKLSVTLLWFSNGYYTPEVIKLGPGSRTRAMVLRTLGDTNGIEF